VNHISLVLYNSHNPIDHIGKISEATFVPRENEYILFENKEYVVDRVIHCTVKSKETVGSTLTYITHVIDYIVLRVTLVKEKW
jgi:hypothetical protein